MGSLAEFFTTVLSRKEVDFYIGPMNLSLVLAAEFSNHNSPPQKINK